MNKKIIILIVIVFLWSSSVFAHSGRLDGQGGHRVNKAWVYTGRYIIVKNGIKNLQYGNIIFKAGDYHFHCRPELNGFKDGFYIPAESNEVKNIQTATVVKSEENRIASKESNVYHKPACSIIKHIKEENVVIFEDKGEAEKNNYVSCGVCKGDEK